MNKINIDKAKEGRRGSEIADSWALATHEHRLAPGTKLGDDDLGEIHGVNRTVVRAAELMKSHLVDLLTSLGPRTAAPARSRKEALHG